MRAILPGFPVPDVGRQDPGRGGRRLDAGHGGRSLAPFHTRVWRLGMMPDGELLLFGCGKMGGALLEGWIARGLAPGRALIVEPDAAIAERLAEKGVRHAPDAAQIPADLRPDVVVLAVKPQMMDSVAAAAARFAVPGTFFLSIAAGKSLAYFAQRLGPSAAV